MTKRLIEIDDDVLDEARRVLGTATLKDTVNESLRITARQARRSRVSASDIAAFAEAAADLGDPEVMAKAWE